MVTKKQSLAALVARYESEEHKEYIRSHNLTKRCTAGKRTPGFEGCKQEKYLYEFPLIVQYVKGAHSYEPDADGAMRRGTCKECLRAYNNQVMRERRAKVFNKEEAISILKGYCSTTLKTEWENAKLLSSLPGIIEAEEKDQYMFLEVEKIKKELKKEIM